MNIGINGYEAVIPRFGYDKEGLPNRVGSSIYCYELLVNLNKIDKKNKYLIYLPASPTHDMPKESSNWKYKVIRARKLWTVTALTQDFLLKKEKIDVFFTPTHYLPPFAPKNSVISVLDVSYILFPNLFKKKDLIQLKKWTGYSVKRAKKIFTISQSSKSDIIKEYGIDSRKVEVVYPGIKLVSSIQYSVLSMDELRNKFGIKNKYILFVGTIQPRKNIVRLIDAFSRIVSNENRIDSNKLDNDSRNLKNLQLVVVGKKGWQFEEIFSSPQKYGVKDRVLFLDNIGNDELPAFYKNAQFFILPSLYEGFGLPVLEAMKYGCAVITSNVSSLPEAGGEAVLYVDPENVDDISSKMQKLLDDKNLREELVKKGYKQIEKFSWEKSARETLKVLEEVANG